MVVLRPRRPGRKPGMAYGRHARRPVPDPDQVSRVIDVGLPEACPHCGGASASSGWPASINKTSPLPATESCRNDIQIGRCQQCRRRIQPRHPEQTSQALGAAGVQVGPRAVALAAWASKAVGCVNVFMQLAGTREPDRRVGPVDAVCLDDPWRPR
jgi:transposase